MLKQTGYLVPIVTFELPNRLLFWHMLYGHLVPTWTFELPKLTTVFYLDIYSAIWTFELPIRMIGSNQRILELENLYYR